MAHGGSVWREADVNGSDLEAVITDLMGGEYFGPLCVVTINTTENWSRDVTVGVAWAIHERCDLAYKYAPAWLGNLVHTCPSGAPTASSGKNRIPASRLHEICLALNNVPISGHSKA